VRPVRPTMMGHKMHSSREVGVQPKWEVRLARERTASAEFTGWTEPQWRSALLTWRVTSANHDTGLALDWPHYCLHATDLCGGPAGWCYTFQGNQAWKNHDRKVVMVDILARTQRQLFAELVTREVHEAVGEGVLAYPNLRYSGSGEMTRAHLPALKLIAANSIHLWGFTRQLDLVEPLRQIGAGVLFSCDRSTSSEAFQTARELRVGLAYTSSSIDDSPPPNTVVVFPLHRGGRVKEVVDSEGLCPKVLEDFMYDERSERFCQTKCHRCHGVAS
jgi:hypothetical protein